MEPQQPSKEKIRSQCVFCQIADGKIPSLTIYQDEKVLCFLDINPATVGHVLIIPKEHYTIFNQMPDELIEHIGIIAKKISLVLIKSLGAEGTNIFFANGAVAGQKAPHFLIHVIPRYNKEKEEKISKTINKLNPEKKVVGQNDIISLSTKLKPEITKIFEKNKLSIEGIDKKNIKISENHLVYGDDKYFAFIPDRQLGKLEIALTTKKHNVIIEKLEDNEIGDLFKISNRLMIILFEMFNAQGTNLLIQNGTRAGQEINQFLIHIIPRFENDGIDFQWEPRKASQEELKGVYNLISQNSNLIFVDKKKEIKVIEEQKPIVLGEDKEEESRKEDLNKKGKNTLNNTNSKENEGNEKTKDIIFKKGDYLIDQLNRIP